MIKTKKIKRLQKVFSLLIVFSLVFQTGSGFLLARPVNAQELTPTPEATEEPTPTYCPIEEPTPVPTQEVTPTEEITPTSEPTPEITSEPIMEPTAEPTQEISPTVEPTSEPEVTETPVAQETSPEPEVSQQEEPTRSPAESTDSGQASDESRGPEGKLEVVIIEETQAELPPLENTCLLTDKPDYTPTEKVLINGTGFMAGATYLLVISSSDEPPVTHEAQVTADEKGEFSYSYQLDGIYRPNYKVEAKDTSGKIIASVNFTDDPGSCKEENAECKINASGKECCEGLVCTSFNPSSGNGKCLKEAIPTPVSPSCPNQATPTPSVSPFPLIDKIDLGDSNSETTHQAEGWGADPGSGNYGGRDGGQTFALVVAPDECNDNGRSARFELNTNGKYANNLRIRHLDGMSNLDSFDVYVNGSFLTRYTDQQDSAEVWRTEEYPLNNLSGVIDVEIILTDQIWQGCATYGQLAINWVEIEGYECQIGCQEGKGWASRVVSNNQGTLKDGSPITDPARIDPNKVLGPNDNTFYSLGKNGWIVLSFSGFVTNEDGDDLSFHEVTWGRNTYYLEKIGVEVSQDGSNWFDIGEVTNEAGVSGTDGITYLDFSSTGLPWIKFVRLTDTTDFSSAPANADGYDLDAVDATNQVCKEPQPSITPTPLPTNTPTPSPYCSDGIKNGQEDCDGADGVTTGQNFCSASCHLVPIYDSEHTCPQGTGRSQTAGITTEISGTDPDGQTISLTPGGKYLFEASGTFRPTSPAGWYADAGYTTNNDWSSLASQYGIHGTGDDYAAHALLADLGSGVGVVDWGNYNSSHIYTKYYEPTTANIQFVIGDRYGDWFNTSWQNQTGMSDNSGSLTLNVYECQPVSEVKICKTDNSQNPLTGWRVYLLGEKLNSFSIPSNGSVVNLGTYTSDNYALLASGTYNYGDSRMIADAANSYRYVGLPCSGSTDGWVNGEAASCMGNYLSLNFSVSGGPTAPGWGTYYNPEHKYAKVFSGGNLQAKIWDRCNSSQLEGCYGDNEGSLNLDIYKGYVSDTGDDGCVTFSNVPYGNYQLGEVLKDDWEKVSGEGEATVDSSQETFVLVNRVAPKYGRLEITKVVDWKNVSPDTSKNFEICVAGPSYPNGDCKTADYDGGTLVWDNLLVGQYSVNETNPGPNWIVTYSSQQAVVNNNQTTSVQVKNEINPVIIKAYKVVCDSEQYLPNRGNHGSTIGANTAQNFVNNSQGHCRLDDGWKFQYAKAGSGSFGSFQTNTSELDSPWVSFGPTVGGEATITLGDISGFGVRIEMREVFKDNSYMPFSNDDNNNLSAEFYCTGDVYHYDNWEWINNPQYGQTYYCVAFNAPNYGSISGVKYDDYDGDGKRDDGEPVLKGWTIFLDKNDNGILDDDETFSTTGDNGDYQFENLLPGEYSVCEVEQAGWLRTQPLSLNCQSVTVTPGNESSGVNFGNFKLGQIKACKYEDLDGDGVKDEGELGIAGVSLILEKSWEGWKEAATGETEQDGCYTFGELGPGTYRVKEDLTDPEIDGYSPTDSFTTEGDYRVTDEIVMVSGGNFVRDFVNEAPAGLTLTKTNDHSTGASAGDTVTYTLTVTNNKRKLTNGVVMDVMPFGFTYVTGSGKINGVPATPVIIGPMLLWSLGDLDSDEVVTIEYQAKIPSGASGCYYVNLAYASGKKLGTGTAVGSGLAFSKVPIGQAFSFSVGVGGAVLGAATEGQVLGATLPAAGSNTEYLILALLFIVLGFSIKKFSARKKVV